MFAKVLHYYVDVYSAIHTCVCMCACACVSVCVCVCVCVFDVVDGGIWVYFSWCKAIIVFVVLSVVCGIEHYLVNVIIS